MKDTLEDIRKKLQEGAFQNEEHVRLALVARILQKLGWDIWDPTQVNAEFKPVPSEDRTKVDFALFSNRRTPSVFIEVKAVGKIDNLKRVETQLRDYNRNNTAIFSIITDGAVWRLYSSQTGGEFSNKRFKTLDLLEDDLEDVESALMTFLNKAALDSGEAEKEAKAVLELTQTQRTMEECLPRARRLTQEPPFPSLPDALVALVAEEGFSISREDATTFIMHAPVGISPQVGPQPPDPVCTTGPKPPGPDVVELAVERPGSLKFTSIHDGQIGSETAKNWNALLAAVIKTALVDRGYDVHQLRQWLNVQIKEGTVTDRGFHPVSGTSVSLQYVEANRAWENIFSLAKELGLVVSVRFRWRHNDDAAFPGKEGLLCWSP